MITIYNILSLKGSFSSYTQGKIGPFGLLISISAMIVLLFLSFAASRIRNWPHACLKINDICHDHHHRHYHDAG